ncbi:erythromycin esterase family protein [Streptomyces griseoloalbus]|uniref:Erythromycin esterase family protein n=1 Tax=Streptomyces griseoloalbus TaxID=67303 RepID=A0ABV3E8S2_9ACTN
MKVFRSTRAAPGSVEHTLDRASHRNWYLDLCSLPPSARTWLDVPRPKREIGTHWPRDPDRVSLLRSVDALVHLHEIRPSLLLSARLTPGRRPGGTGARGVRRVRMPLQSGRIGSPAWHCDL